MRTCSAMIILLAFAQPSIAQKLVPQTGHTNDILNVRFSPDDSQLISYSWGDGRLILWDVRTGNLLWMRKTGFIQIAEERSNLVDFWWSEDGRSIVTRSENGRYESWDSQEGHLQSIGDAAPAIRRAKETSRTVAVQRIDDYFHLSDSRTQRSFIVPVFSRTGAVFDVSHDGTKFAEGGSWGRAGIKITDLVTGKSRVLDGKEGEKQRPPYRPGSLELRLTAEADQRRAELSAAREERAKRAAIETMLHAGKIFVRFEHYGDMASPGDLKIMESGEASKSAVTKPEQDANAAWLRLSNESPLPIEIPTQSLYLSKCSYTGPDGGVLPGLCNNQEISLWFGLQNKRGKPIPYGFDFGSSAMLLPNTSVLFALPREIFKDGNAVRFSYKFQKDDHGRRFEDYGDARTFILRESDLFGTRSK